MAEPAKYGLNEDEVVILRGVVARVKNGTLNTGKTSDYKTDAEEQQGPEVYIARTPEGGIPGLVFVDEEIGTGSGSPVAAEAMYQPGSADCLIYELIEDGTNDPYLVQVSDSFLTVYNLSETPIASYTLVTVSRDKYGRWVCILATQTSNTYLIRAPFAGISALSPGLLPDTGTGTGTGTALADDSPGSAYCNVYKITDGNTLERTGIEKLVYNMHTVDIPAYTICLISQDVYGKWIISEVFWETAEC